MNNEKKAAAEPKAGEGKLKKFKANFIEECRCLHGFPVTLPIPAEGETCPFFGEQNHSFRRLIDAGVLIRRRAKGLKEGSANVYGPSACDDKYGCRCGLRHGLAELRAEDAAVREDSKAKDNSAVPTNQQNVEEKAQ